MSDTNKKTVKDVLQTVHDALRVMNNRINSNMHRIESIVELLIEKKIFDEGEFNSLVRINTEIFEEFQNTDNEKQ